MEGQLQQLVGVWDFEHRETSGRAGARQHASWSRAPFPNGWSTLFAKVLSGSGHFDHVDIIEYAEN